MQFFLLGLLLLIFILLAGRAFTRADPGSLSKRIRSAGGWTLLIMAVAMLATGRAVLALPLGLVGLSLLGFSIPGLSGSPQRNSRKTQGQRSTVRTEMLEMTLDHDSGEMDGLVRKGRFKGWKLSQLTPANLQDLLTETRQNDAKATQLLEAYIARFQQGAASNGAGQSRGGGPRGAAMSVEEAYAVLGLTPGASREDVHQAHRELMKRYHPDHGGTTYLATKINEAKDVLLQTAQ